MKKLLAIDLGASSGRGMIGEFDGKKLTLREIHRFTNDTVMENGIFCWDTLRLFHEIKQAIRTAVLNGENISSLGIDTWGVDYGYIDKQGHLMNNTVNHRDTRTAGMVESSTDKITKEELYNITGLQFADLNTVYQILCDMRDRPYLPENAEQLLCIPDLLNYFLTGKAVNEYTIMSTTALLDAKTRDYSPEVFKKTGIPEKLFRPIVQPGTKLGKLLPQVQSETGKTDVDVYTVASHDTASALISVPTQEDDFICISSGTWSLMGTELKEPCITDTTRTLNYTNEGGACRTIRFLKNIVGLWIIQESRRQWKREGKDYSFAQLEMFAREAKPFQCLIDPADPLFVTQGDMPGKIRDYCRATGQYVPKTEGEVMRCIYESLALKYRAVAADVEQCTGRKAKVIHIVGGGSKDTFLSQMTADAIGVPVVGGPTEATAIGNMMMQLMAQGDVKDLKEARKIIANSFDLVRFEPAEDRSAWDKAFTKFCELK